MNILAYVYTKQRFDAALCGLHKADERFFVYLYLADRDERLERQARNAMRILACAYTKLAKDMRGVRVRPVVTHRANIARGCSLY